jgi:hypothetical protein
VEFKKKYKNGCSWLKKKLDDLWVSTVVADIGLGIKTHPSPDLHQNWQHGPTSSKVQLFNVRNGRSSEKNE